MSNPNDFNQAIIDEFHANGGKVGGQFAGGTLLLLHTVGAKSKQARVNPLAYMKDGDNYIIVASKAGAPTNPDWYYNIVADPEVAIEVGTERIQTHATVFTDGEERERLYALIVSQMPGFAEYQRNTTRRIPVVVLTPVA